MTTLDPLLKAEEVAKCLRVAPKTVHNLARKGEIGFVKVNGRDRRFTLEQVDDYIQRTSVSPRVDVTPKARVSSQTKGGKKSVGANGTGLLREEIKRLCR